MKTVKSIKESVNVSEILSNDKYGTFEDLSNEQVILFSSATEISNLIQNECERNAHQISYSNTVVSFEITNEKVIELFRELYKMTNNNFVKSVLVSVGKNKKFTEKQIIIITDEIVKFNNLEINFI